MSWKKDVDLLDTEPNEAGSNQQRDHFRVAPERDEPVILLLEGQMLPVFDISAGGFSCRAPHLQTGMRYRVRLNLPSVDNNLNACADLLRRDGDQCHFRFIDLQQSQRAGLNYYVLQRQKRLIRATRDSSAQRMF